MNWFGLKPEADKDAPAITPNRLLIAALMRNKLVSLLVLICVISAMAVAYNSHQYRQALMAQERILDEQNELELQWQKLSLEQSGLEEHSNVEMLARKKLGMRHLDGESERVIKP